MSCPVGEFCSKLCAGDPDFDGEGNGTDGETCSSLFDFTSNPTGDLAEDGGPAAAFKEPKKNISPSRT